MTTSSTGGAAQSRTDGRLAAAKAALGRAEQAVGMRARLTVLPGGAPVPQPSAAPEREGQLATAEGGGAVRGPAAHQDAVSVRGAQQLGDVLRVPTPLEPLLPSGIPRGSVVQVSGSTSLLMAMAGAALSSGAWCAVAAAPHLGWAAAATAGLPLERVVAVPTPGPDAPVVLAALADGFDVLVVGRCPALTERDQRSLTARLRARDAVLFTSAPWPDAHLHLAATTQAWHGLEAGAGYLRGVDLRITVTGRLALRSGTDGHAADVRLGAGGLRSQPPARTAAEPATTRVPGALSAVG